MHQETTRVDEVDASCFEQYLTSIWEQLVEEQELPASEPPEGSGELLGARGRVAYVVARQARFAAWQWSENGALCESFFVRPADGRARCGWRRVSSDAAHQGATRTPDWYVELQPVSSRLRTGEAPSFLELLALWSASGHASPPDTALLQANEDLQAQLDYYRQAAAEHAEESRQLRARLRNLLAHRSRADTQTEDASDAAAAQEPLRDLSGLAEWAEQNASRITVLGRALGAAKRSLYEEPAHIYQALEVLAGPYREHRSGRLDRAGFEAALSANGLRLAGSVGSSVAGMHGEAYFVSYRGQRRFLEMHLLRGGGRDERYCLRVYFFWDDDARQAVVGWLPSHLDNSLT